MFDVELANKIDDFIKEKFGVIYEYNFEGFVLLRGGAIRNLIMGIPVNDLDFVILTQGKCQIIDFIRKFKLRYHKNAGNGYKIYLEDFTIDISSYSDLLDTATYDIDYIFYDIERRLFISCGGFRAIETRTITEVNNHTVPSKKNILRLEKLIEFIKYVTKDDRKVRVCQNMVLFKLRLYKKRVGYYWHKLFDNSFKNCFVFLDGCRKEFNKIVGFNLLLGIVVILFSILAGQLYKMIMLNDYINVVLIVILFVLLMILNFLVCNKLKKYKDSFRNKMSYNVSSQIVNCVLNCKLDNIDTNNYVFINKLKRDPNMISMRFLDVANMIIKMFDILIMLIMVFLINYSVGILIFLWMFIFLLVQRYNLKRIKRNFSLKKKYGDLFNCIGTYGDMFYLRRDGLVCDEQLIKRYCGKKISVIYIVCFVVILVFEIVMLYVENLNMFSFIMLMMYTVMMYANLNKIDKLSLSFFYLSRSCYRVFNLINGSLYVREVFGNKYFIKCSGKIEFKNVKFRYDCHSNYILDMFSFKIMPNEILGIEGGNMSGKTTILNLIARLYNVDDGEVMIDDVNISEYDEKYIRENVAIISQSPYFFNMSIRDNLRLVNKNISDEEIVKICKLVCLDNFINSLTDGYSTIIGDGGIKLTGLQKQKLGIARALIKNIRIILLDDVVYNSVDDIIEIKNIIKKISRGHTIIVITNNQDILKICSKKLLLKSGLFIEKSNDNFKIVSM